MKKDFDKYRDLINNIDLELIKLLSARMRLSQKIASIKLKNNLPVFDSQREDQVKSKLTTVSSRYRLRKDFILKIFTLIMGESKKIQHTLTKKRKNDIISR